MNKYLLILESLSKDLRQSVVTEAEKKSKEPKKPWHDKIGRKLVGAGAGAGLAGHLLRGPGKLGAVGAGLRTAGKISAIGGVGTGVAKKLGGYYKKDEK